MDEEESWHQLESALIELEYVIKGMQKLPNDDGVLIVWLDIMEEKMNAFKECFYGAWKRKRKLESF